MGKPEALRPQGKTRAGTPATFCGELSRVKLSTVLASLPPRAEDMLRTQDITRSEYTNLLGSHVIWCSDMTTDEARALAQILDGAGQERHEDVFGLRYVFEQPAPGTTEVSVTVEPLLPHEA